MKQKVILVAFFALILSACQHTAEQTTPTINQSSTTVNQHSTTVTPSSPANNTQTTINQPTVYTSPNTTGSVQQVYTNNLLDRIRAGFQFPEFHSEHIAQYEKWNSTHPRYLKDLFKRSEPFLHHIVEEIEKRGLPMEIALLPAVESAYKPNAVSRSKAAGLWQFIPSTGKSFGLTQDWWYDGRRDVLLSTNAALDYLTQLNKRFNGDWFITLAAYNAGQGNVAKAIKSNTRKGKPADYSSLSLRSETRRYVPKLIALKNIINNPHHFNVKLPVIANSPKFEVITLKGQVDLNKFSEQTGVDPKTLNHLNAGFLRWATSPNGPHRILLPVDDRMAIQKAHIAAQQTIKLDYQRHSIAPGDSLSSISRRYGVSVSALKTSNKLSSSRIRAGKTLLIPVNGKPVAQASTRPSTPNVAVATLVSSNNALSQNTKVVHQVRRGDTLWGIARQYKVKMNQLLAWNQLSKNQTLRLNQSLVLFP